MRRMASILVALAVVVTVPGAVAQQQPQVQAPAEQALAAPPAVLVLPFTMLGDNGQHDWIGQGIQQNLQAELGRAGLDVVGTVQVKPMNRAPVLVRPEDQAEAALQMATEARADVLVYGSYHVVDQTVRITGQVVDVASGQTVGFIKADGTLRDLLSLEDQLATQTLNFFQQAEGAGEAVAVEESRVPLREDLATQPAETVVVEQEPVIYDPLPAETTVVYSPRYYDDDIDEYDWIGAATYVYPTYYPVGYYYPSYSYYYKPYCYRPWYWSSFSIGFHFGKHYGHHRYYDRHDYHHRSHRYSNWHRDDDHRHRYASRDRYEGSRGDLRDRGSRFRDGQGDWRRDSGDARQRSDRRTILAVDRRGDDGGAKQQEPRVVRYRNVRDNDGKPRYVAARGIDRSGDRRMPEVGPPTRREPAIDKTRETIRPRVASRDEGNKRVTAVPDRDARNDRSAREPVVKRIAPPTASTSDRDRVDRSGADRSGADRDRAARLVNPDRAKSERAASPRVEPPDRAARLMGKDDPNSGRTTARSDPDRAAQLLRGSERSSSIRRSEPSRSTLKQSSSILKSRSAQPSPRAADRASAAIRSREPAARSSAFSSRSAASSRSSDISSRSASRGSSFRSSSGGSSARSSGSSSRSSSRSSSSGSGRSGRGK